MLSNLTDELRWRGLVKQRTDLEALRAALSEGSATFYCGFDPTAASLHHEHLVQLIVMHRLQLAGRYSIALIGGTTGLAGDPRMTTGRQLQDKETVSEWIEKLKIQVSKFLGSDGANPARMMGNRDWTKPLPVIDLLRGLGKHLRMGTMLAKGTAACHPKSEEKISYIGFSYQILQTNGFLQLYRKYGTVLETGGNDQWGNLVDGMDLIRKVEDANVHVVTTPLITKFDGIRPSKSEGGVIRLGPGVFSPYAFYQFWLNVRDTDVTHFLRVFTFISRGEIEDLERQIAENPDARAAQKALAEAVAALVYRAEETS